MSQRANPILVGSFIVAGVLLALGCVIVFGSLRWFSPMHTFIVYFEETAEGLDEGSVVKFRGVTIGRVKEVLIHFNQARQDYHLPILIEIDERRLRSKIDVDIGLTDPDYLGRAVTNGLRARLELESLVTGRLYVSLIMDTNAGPPAFHQLEPIHHEIPSQLTDLAQIKRALVQIKGINVVGIAQKIESLLDRLNQTLDNLRTDRVSETAISTMNTFKRLAGSPEITNALVAVRQAAEQFRSVAAKLETQVDPLAGDARRTLDEAVRFMAEARAAVEDLRGMVQSRSPLRTQLDGLMTNLSEAADSVAALAEFLRRNPQALLSGRERATPRP
jgi:paraquat-inducible protein B